MTEEAGNRGDRVRAQNDSYRAQSDSDRAGADSGRAQDDSDRRDRRAIFRILAYVGLGLAGAAGLWYVQDTADEAHDTATKFKAAEAREEIEETQEDLENCQTRNTAVNNGRERFAQFSRNITVLFGQGSLTPEEQKQVQTILFKDINLDPAVEDIDCNKDGELTPQDYAP